MNYIKVVNVKPPDESTGRAEVVLIVGKYDGPTLRAKKVSIPIGSSLEIDPEFFVQDDGPALGVSVYDGVGTKDRFGG